MRRLLAGLIVFAATPLAAQVVQPDPPVKAMMMTTVNPAALAFWAGGNEPPEDETPAAADARWTEALNGAQALQAGGLALQRPEHTRPGRWNEYAQSMVDTGAEGEAAARAKDPERSFEIGGRLYEACDGCHKAYIPTPPRSP